MFSDTRSPDGSTDRSRAEPNEVNSSETATLEIVAFDDFAIMRWEDDGGKPAEVLTRSASSIAELQLMKCI